MTSIDINFWISIITKNKNDIDKCLLGMVNWDNLEKELINRLLRDEIVS